MRKGICAICGNAELLSSCSGCGALICVKCMKDGICNKCRQGRQHKGKD